MPFKPDWVVHRRPRGRDMPRRMSRSRIQTLVVLVAAVAVLGQTVDCIHGVLRNGSASDFATYHYAWQAVLSGESPYDTATLSQLARLEHTRGSVHPFFYPPPYLLTMVWDHGLPLRTAFLVWLGVNLAALAGCLVLLRRWLNTPTWVLWAVVASLTPLYNSFKMGQANQLVLFIALLGLSSSSPVRQGAGIAAAAMAKMSPALYLTLPLIRGSIRTIVAAAVVVIAVSIAILPWVGLSEQLRFYTEILPGFSTGEYHGLRVPITLPANHSIPDLFHMVWPGPDNHHLDPRAAWASKAVAVALLGGVAWVARRVAPGDTLGEAAIAGALSVLMVITPVYAYEHHLAFLLIPGVVLAVAAERGRLRRWWVRVAAAGWVAVCMPLALVRWVWTNVPAPFDSIVQESKFVGLLCVMAACLWVAQTQSGDER